MHPDKKIMLAALILLIVFAVIAFVFKGIDLDEENDLLDETEVLELTEKFPDIYYYPLNNKERMTIIQEYLEKISAIQNRISKTYIAKYALDYSEPINNLQNLLSVLRHSAGSERENEISFSTMQEHSIVSDQEFTKDALLNLASILDNTFPGDRGNALFILNCEYGYLELTILPYESPDHFINVDLQEFASLLSNEVFNGDPVFIEVHSDDVEKSVSLDG